MERREFHWKRRTGHVEPEVQAGASGDAAAADRSGDGEQEDAAAYFTWNGALLEGTGIKPDIEVELSCDALRAGSDTQLQKAIEVVETLGKGFADLLHAKPSLNLAPSLSGLEPRGH